MSGKSAIKKDVFRSAFYNCAFAAQKDVTDGRTSGIPKLTNNPVSLAALDCIVNAIDDTGVRMHALTYVPGMMGETLLDLVLAPVRRFFNEMPHGQTYVIRLDYGIFTPAPKRATQAGRSKNLAAQLERTNTLPIDWVVGEPVPSLIERNVPLPNWLAVLADRTLFRHACSQLMELIASEYAPPPGCRLILDYNDRRTTSGVGLLDEWMRSERIICSPFAQQKIDSARRRFAREPRWHKDADDLVYELAHAGHIKIIPLCIETAFSGETYVPFLLPNAAHNCGEADLGNIFWVDALQAQKLHHTLAGLRRFNLPIAAESAQFYTPAQVLATEVSSRRRGANPQPIEVQRQNAIAMLDADPDLIIAASETSDLSRLLTYAMQPGESSGRLACGASMVISVDTDFLSLLPLWYAQFCYERSATPADAAYCQTHAPFLSIGECKVKKYGWISAPEDFATEENSSAPNAAGVVVQNVPLTAYEIWDIGRLCKRIVDATANGSPRERIASFAMFCALCKNDYLPGFHGINRKFAYAAFQACGSSLVDWTTCGRSMLQLANMIEFIKHSYHASLMAKKGAKNKPPRAARLMTYVQMARIVKEKYVKSLKSHMPDARAIRLLYKRSQWWISMATEAWRDIGAILDDRMWGWAPEDAQLEAADDEDE